MWRKASVPVEEVALDPAGGDAAAQLQERFDPRRLRSMCARRRCCAASWRTTASQDRWLLLLLYHHLAMDHTTLEVVIGEVQAHLLGRSGELPAPVPFRNFVAQARLGVSTAEHEAFFRGMLGDVEEPTLPFGLMDVQGEGRGIEEARLALDAELAAAFAGAGAGLGVSAASLFHLAWAQVLARTSGPRGRGVRHGAVRPHAGRRGSGPGAGDVHQHAAGAPWRRR